MTDSNGPETPETPRQPEASLVNKETSHNENAIRVEPEADSYHKFTININDPDSIYEYFKDRAKSIKDSKTFTERGTATEIFKLGSLNFKDDRLTNIEIYGIPSEDMFNFQLKIEGQSPLSINKDFLKKILGDRFSDADSRDWFIRGDNKPSNYVVNTELKGTGSIELKSENALQPFEKLDRNFFRENLTSFAKVSKDLIDAVYEGDIWNLRKPSPNEILEVQIPSTWT